MHYLVIEDWTAAYANPIELVAGERLDLTGRAEDWDGHRWLWARSANGLEGWVPASLVDGAAGTVRAKAGYSARELTCRAGETVVELEATHGWVRCRAEDGRTGWVPERNLRRCPSAPDAPLREFGES